MATELQPYTLKDTFIAGADLSAATNQYKFVKMNGTGQQVVLCAAATDRPIGVLQNTPPSGGAAEVVLIGRSKIQADAALNPGDLIGTSADGQADAKIIGTDVTNYAVGVVFEGAAAADEIISAFINCVTPPMAVTGN